MNLTSTKLLGTNREHRRDNNIPVNIYNNLQPYSKYTEPHNNNDNNIQNLIQALIRKLKIINDRSSICVTKGKVFEYQIFCNDESKRNSGLKDHSGRSYQNTQWSEYNKYSTDLTKNNANKFSKDYIDLKELGRTDFQTDRFSRDYLDVDDLARRDDTPHKVNRAVEMYPGYHPVPTHIFDFINLRKSLLRHKYKDFQKHNKGRSDSSDSVDDTSLDDSDEESIDKSKNNRFKIVKPEKFFSTTSEEESSVELPVEKKMFIVKDESESHSEESQNEDYFVYMQGRNRIIDENDVDRRKRLEHFIPKRFHRDEDDFKNLGYYWFNGHKGKYAEAWRPGALY